MNQLAAVHSHPAAVSARRAGGPGVAGAASSPAGDRGTIFRTLVAEFRGLAAAGIAVVVATLASATAASATALPASAPASVPAQLRVVGDDNYPPFLFRDPAGRAVGYVADWWQLWERKTGVKVELSALPWAEAQRVMQRGGADVIDNIFRTPGRERIYDFTAPYARVPVGVFASNAITGIQDVRGLRGFQVGVMDGDACVEMLEREGVRSLHVYPSYAALVAGALADEVRIFCLDDYPANYYLYRAQAEHQFRKAFQLYEGEFHRAVPKGRHDLLALVERGTAAITPDEDAELRRKWMPPPGIDYGHYARPVAIAVALLGLLALVLLAWVRSLRSAVRRQTAELREAQVALGERVKEQACLYAVFRASEDLARPLPQVLADVVAVLPAGWYFPETTVARIDWDGAAYETGSLSGAVARMSAELRVGGRTRGQVTVAYRDERPAQQEGPFLVEERRLIDAVAERLASVIERRAADERLHESEERFRRLFEDTRQPILLAEDGRFTAANRASLAMLRIDDPAEFIGRTPQDISPEMQPDGTPSAVKVHEVIRTAFEQGAHEFEWEHVRANGEHFIARVLLTPIRIAGRELLHVVWNDITAQKQAEAALARYHDELEQRVADRTAELAAASVSLRAANAQQQAIFDAATVGILLTRNRVIVSCNRTLEQMFGYAPGELVGRSTRELYGSDAAFAEIGAGIAASFAQHGHFREEREAVRRDGSRFWARLMARFVDGDDPDKGMAATIDDITAERAVADQMAHARALAEDAARAKAEFLANMSHEIRTPMNAVIGMTYLALKADPPPRLHDYLVKIHASGQHLLGILNDILDFSKIEAGNLTLEQVDFALEQVLDRAIAQVAERAAAKGLEIIVAVDDGVPPNLVGDPLRVAQVLINYANNAVKFTDRGEIAIRVSVESGAEDNLMLRFSVRDTGIGIDAEQRDRLFRSFQQGDTSTTRKYGGTGLGLAISKRLADLMGGTVGFDSTPGVGSTFWFTARLPRGQGCAEPLLPRPDLRGLRVLVVDDNDYAREVIGEMLRAMTFSVGTAASGEAALVEIDRAAAAGEAYEVVLVDWKMPGMDGVAAARAIRTLPLRAIPLVLMITAYDHSQLQPIAVAASVDDVLVKPISASALFNALMKVFGAPAAGPPRAFRGPSGPLPDVSRIAGAQVLLVEDNTLNQEVAIALLREIGVDVDLAEDGAAAVRMVVAKTYDIVLMDLQMPVLDGLEATRAIRALPGQRDLPIVAMTASALASDRQRCLDAGMNDYIAKPIDPGELTGRLLQWIRPRQPDAAASPAAGPASAPAAAPPEAALPGTGGLAGLGEIAGLDVTLGLRQSLGREALYRSLLAGFVRAESDAPQRIAQALGADDWTLAQRAAHSLKGAAMQIGAGDIRALAERLEQAIRDRHAAATLEGLQAELSQALPPLVTAIRAGLPPPTAP